MEPPTNPPIEIDDITNDEDNRRILRQLSGNAPSFVHLTAIGEINSDERESYEYDATKGGLEWLGYFMSKNVHLTHVHLAFFGEGELDALSEGINFNRSISSLEIFDSEVGRFFRKLVLFFKKNDHLNSLSVRHCELEPEGGRDLAVALAECPSKSFTDITLKGCQLDDETLARIFTALGIQPELKNLCLTGNDLGRRGCLALTPLLHNSKPKMLKFNSNQIDDQGVELLAGALKGNEKLWWLQMEGNRMTNRGFRALSTLLLTSSSKLSSLHIEDMDFDDDAALIFSKALEMNSTLGDLHFSLNHISSEGWGYFARALCNTSTVAKTFHSNHTVSSFGFDEDLGILEEGPRLPANIQSILELNGNGDEMMVARNKILKYHDLDMSAFFAWEFKLLPMLMKCFETTDRSIATNVDRKKLCSIFQFIRGNPELYLDSVQGKVATRANKKQRL